MGWSQARVAERARRLGHMHARGVVHTDVSPKNIFLRGAGPHRRAWSRALRRGCVSQDSPLADPETKPEVTAAFDAHLPCTFEVGGEATSVGSAPPPRTTRSFEQSVRMNKASNIIRTVGSRDQRRLTTHIFKFHYFILRSHSCRSRKKHFYS